MLNALAMTVLLASSMTHSGTTSPYEAAKARVASHQYQINAGRRDGSLTRRELKNATANQLRLRRALSRSVRDGFFSRSERRFMKRLLARANSQMYRYRTNKARRFFRATNLRYKRAFVRYPRRAYKTRVLRKSTAPLRKVKTHLFI